MKRNIIVILLALCLCISLLPGAACGATIVDSGKCGENLTWELDSEGTLTISGTGEMDSYQLKSNGNYPSLDTGSPWMDHNIDD